MYNLLFPGVSYAVIPRSYDKYTSLQCEMFVSSISRLNRCSHVLAKWAAQFDGRVDMQSTDLPPGVIQYFFKHSIFVGEKNYIFCFARVDLFQRHPDRIICGSSDQFTLVWCANEFDSFGAASFLPVQRLMRKFVPGYNIVNGESVLFVIIPLAKKFKL